MVNMQYRGKSIDTFGDAVKMLLINHGYDAVPYADCISLRSFAFRVNEDDWENWLIPQVEPMDAVTRLFKFIGLGSCIQIEKETEHIWNLMEQGCLIGPVCEINQYDVQRLYYDGMKKYLYICSERGGHYIVHDPDGFPLKLADKAEVIKSYGIDNAVAVGLRLGGKQKKSIDYKRILKEGLSYRRKNEKMLFWPKPQKRFQKIAVLCGAYNYLMQIYKILDLTKYVDCLPSAEAEKIDQIVKELYRCILADNMEKFIYLKNEFFILLEDEMN